MTDTEEEENPDLDSLEELMQKAATPVGFDATFRYQRALIPSQKIRRPQEKYIEARTEESKRCKPLTSYLQPAKRKAAAMDSVGAAHREQLNDKELETAYKERMCNTAGISTVEVQREVREEKIRLLEMWMRSTDSTSCLGEQNLNRQRAVLALLYLQRSKPLGETWSSMATIVSHTFNRGPDFARKIVTWEISSLKNVFIEDGRQDCFA